VVASIQRRSLMNAKLRIPEHGVHRRGQVSWQYLISNKKGGKRKMKEFSKELRIAKIIGEVIVTVKVDEYNTLITVTTPDGKTLIGSLNGDIIRINPAITYAGKKFGGIKIDDKNQLKELNDFIAEAKQKLFLENPQTITYSYRFGYSVNTQKKYSQAALKRVYEAHKVKNDDYDIFDGFTTPYLFPKMFGKDLIKLLDEAEAEVIKERQEKEIQKQKALEAKFEEAKRTGKPVLIKREGGMNSNNFDEGWAWVYITYAMPNGTQKTEKVKDIWD
jgi:hypothetical protein